MLRTCFFKVVLGNLKVSSKGVTTWMMPEERETLVAVYRTEGTNVEAEGPANKAVTGKTVL